MISKKYSDRNSLLSIEKEVEALKKLECIFIVKFIEHFEDEDNAYVVLEYAELETLEKLVDDLKNMKVKLNEL